MVISLAFPGFQHLELELVCVSVADRHLVTGSNDRSQSLQSILNINCIFSDRRDPASPTHTDRSKRVRPHILIIYSSPDDRGQGPARGMAPPQLVAQFMFPSPSGSGWMNGVIPPTQPCRGFPFFQAM